MAAEIEYLIDPVVTQEVVEAKNKLKQQADRAEDILDSLENGTGGGEGGIEEAPEDNDKYVRENGAWVVLPDYPTIPEIIPEAPEDGKTYGRKSGAWAEIDTSGSGGGTVSEWGDIQGTLSNQTDLQTALDSKIENVSWGDVEGSLADQADLKTALDSKIETLYWGNIEGSINLQEDLKTALDSKIESLELDLNTAYSSKLVLTNSAGDDLEIPAASTDHAGLMTVGDRNKLSGLDKPDWNTPESEAGGISNKPTLGSLSSEDDAPSDGKQYARKDGAWSEVEAGSAGGGSESYTRFSLTPTITNLGLDQGQAATDGGYKPQLLDFFANNDIKGNVLKLGIGNDANTMNIELPDPAELGWNVGDQFVLDIGTMVAYRQDSFGKLVIRPSGPVSGGDTYGKYLFSATAQDIEGSPLFNPINKQCCLLLTVKEDTRPSANSMVFNVGSF